MPNMEEMIIKFHRVGALDRARWLETIDQKIPRSFKERIKLNDKKVLRELILPTWIEWDFLREWALSESAGEDCHFCGKNVEKYSIHRDNVICNNCIDEIKQLNR